MWKNKIKFLVMDVDGTLTDGRIYMGSNGELFKAFDIKDGCGIKDLLPKEDIVPVIITARESMILENRCRELAVTELYQGIRNKRKKLDEILLKFSQQYKEEYSYANVAYIGDDILDIPCMLPVREAGGAAGCPADAVKEVKAIADFVSSKNGGSGAVREFIEWLI
ncbi:MAG: 3-deoxy-D-manno-octulosonate 8-phosphate phosphatase [Lachnospiraceae bacterium]|nr:3-deoxy-D-manno-octulosonate 8-phosphate phosphatase [Lachnospiraceae bacterium]